MSSPPEPRPRLSARAPAPLKAIRGASTVSTHAAIATGDAKADIEGTVAATGLPAERVEAAVAAARASSQAALGGGMATLRGGLGPLLTAATDAHERLRRVAALCEQSRAESCRGEAEGGLQEGRAEGEERQLEERHPLCHWGDAAGLGLPDGPSAWEDIELWNLRHASDSSGREERERRRAWACGLRRALDPLRPPLERLRKQLDWSELHWRALQERLYPLEPLAAAEEDGAARASEQPARFESVLYSGRDADEYTDERTGWR